MAHSRRNLLSDKIVFGASRQGSVTLPLNGLINKARLRITGTYSGIDGTLAAEFPQNILRSIIVKTTTGGNNAYAIPSKDLRIMNYLDKAGKVVQSASGGNFEMNLVLDRGELLAIKDSDLPKDAKGNSLVNHPVLPMGGLTLAVIFANDSDITTGANTILTATIEIELEETPITVAELQRIYGLGLERYQFPQVFVIGDVAVTLNSAPTKSIVPSTGNLKKRIIVVTSDGATPPARTNATVTELLLKNKQTGQEPIPIDRTFATMQNEDKEEYNLA